MTDPAVTAKVQISRRHEISDGQVQLEFQADYDDGRNKEWAKYTPGLSINMTVKPEVAHHFPDGAAFKLTFEQEAE